jgi:hypothetical protein
MYKPRPVYIKPIRNTTRDVSGYNIESLSTVYLDVEAAVYPPYNVNLPGVV